MPNSFIQKVVKHKRFWVGLLALVLLFSPTRAYLDEVQYTYDDLGRLVGVTNAGGETAIYTYDAVGNLLSITRAASGQVAIITFSPTKGTEGTAVEITGLGFSPNPNDNQVTFGGAVSAVVTTSTTTTIETTVPAGAVTGPISITTPTGSAVSSNSFEVLNFNPPVITGIAPVLGQQGQTISQFTIYGENLANATDISFFPSDGIIVSNPPFFEADGTRATVSIAISTSAPTGGRAVVISNPVGSSSSELTPANTFTVMESKPAFSLSKIIRVFVEPSGGDVHSPTVGVEIAAP